MSSPACLKISSGLAFSLRSLNSRQAWFHAPPLLPPFVNALMKVPGNRKCVVVNPEPSIPEPLRQVSGLGEDVVLLPPSGGEPT